VALTSEAVSTNMETRLLDAARQCCDRWGISKVTVDDIAAQAGVSRATLYRVFPGGRDVLFAALRARDVGVFLAGLDDDVRGATSLEDFVVGMLVGATRRLRADAHLQLMLASHPGEVARELGIDGLANIVDQVATVFGPRLRRFLDAEAAVDLAEWVSRMVLSFYLAPSARLDLADVDQVRAFVARFILPGFSGIVGPGRAQ
jgi:AcrR family transcriptional regulator